MFITRERVICFQVEITRLSSGCDIEIESGIDGTVTNSGTQHLYEKQKRLFRGRILSMEAAAAQSQVDISPIAAHACFVDGQEMFPRRLPVMNRRYLGETLSLPLEKGRTLKLGKLCCMHTSRDLVPCDGLAEMEAVLTLGYEALMQESAPPWAVSGSAPYTVLAGCASWAMRCA